MADPVAIVSVISGATVAIGVPFINARLERRRLQHQSRTARLDELRALLDTTLQHLFRGYWILYAIGEERKKQPSSDEWSEERLRELGKELAEETEILAQHGLRVKLRTPAAVALGQTQDRANRIFLQYNAQYRRYLASDLVDQEKPPAPPTDEAWGAVREMIEDIREYVGVVPPTSLD